MWIGIVLLFVVAVAAGGAWFAYDSLVTPRDASAASEEALFEIRPGSTMRTVAQRLESEGLIRWGRSLEIYARVRGLSGSLQAGRYLLSPAMSAVEILGTIVSGDAVFDELTVTIPEGWSVYDIEVYFEELGLFSKERFQEAVVMDERYRDIEILSHLEDNTILDGYLFPDTYRIFADSTPEGIVRRMLENFAARIDPELLDEIARQGRTLHDVLTLASIVQHESADDEEMPAVAGVFWNRLEQGIRLESDATVNYVLGTNKLQPTFADTEVQHPYNTYENSGLPPGPIGNPGLAAIRAAVDPAVHDYRFFLHKPNREIVLSRTFREHLDNKARYLD